ncbi:hypothetical protein L6452_40326 [Arctium lappa]|uniref:Uncharacterized protein n=1 Tax=Arctium lappa TaxID=4217 RepID=A0ACB8XLY8_ARCLA|nr:hypothetical protein L6452_40326 [Arctium lappa]
MEGKGWELGLYLANLLAGDVGLYVGFGTLEAAVLFATVNGLELVWVFWSTKLAKLKLDTGFRTAIGICSIVSKYSVGFGFVLLMFGS